jgi:hypothetical protein
MQRGNLSRQNSYERHQQDSSSEDEDDIQVQAAETRNDSPTAALPITPATEERDLERGPERGRSRSPASNSWRDWATSTFFRFGGRTSSRRHEADRDR